MAVGSKVPRPRLRRRNGQALAALRAAGRENLAAALGLHPVAEAMSLLPVPVTGLECALHCGLFLVSTKG